MRSGTGQWKLDEGEGLSRSKSISGASLIAQTVKNLPEMQENHVRSLGREDPVEKEVAIYSSILARRIPRTEEPGKLQSMGSQIVRHDWVTSLSFFLSLQDSGPVLPV